MMKLLLGIFIGSFVFNLFKNIKKEIKKEINSFRDFKKSQLKETEETEENKDNKVVVSKDTTISKEKSAPKKGTKKVVNIVLAALMVATIFNATDIFSGINKNSWSTKGTTLKQPSKVAELKDSLIKNSSGLSVSKENVLEDVIEETRTTRNGFRLFINKMEHEAEGNVIVENNHIFVNMDLMDGSIVTEDGQKSMTIGKEETFIYDRNVRIIGDKTYVNFEGTSLKAHMNHERISAGAEELTVTYFN